MVFSLFTGEPSIKNKEISVTKRALGLNMLGTAALVCCQMKINMDTKCPLDTKIQIYVYFHIFFSSEFLFKHH